MKAEMIAEVEKAMAAVNAAVAPHGYSVAECLDGQLAEDYGEAWFILESTRPTDKPHKDFFEACYYLSNFPDAGKRGTIVYGVQGEGDWGDLPADPAVACEQFRKENNQN